MNQMPPVAQMKIVLFSGQARSLFAVVNGGARLTPGAGRKPLRHCRWHRQSRKILVEAGWTFD
jgi:hypothetical protein